MVITDNFALTCYVSVEKTVTNFLYSFLTFALLYSYITIFLDSTRISRLPSVNRKCLF